MRLLLLATVTLLATLLAGQIAVRSQRPAGQLMASWKDRPSTLKGTIDLAEEVVVGKVSKIKKADPIVTQTPGEPGNADQIPVEVVTIAVSDNVKGQKTTIELFHTGHSDAVSPMDRREPGETPPPRPATGAVPKSQRPRDPGSHGGVVLSVMDDPGYQVGEEYVLFVRKGPKLRVDGSDVDTLAIVSPEGRFRVKGDKTVEPLSTRAFAQAFKGKPVKNLRDRAAAATQ